MALLLAPYNNAMRLGQGFNSYTQQVCIDDAVVIDPDRPANVVTNIGDTMEDLAMAMAEQIERDKERLTQRAESGDSGERSSSIRADSDGSDDLVHVSAPSTNPVAAAREAEEESEKLTDEERRKKAGEKKAEEAANLKGKSLEEVEKKKDGIKFEKRGIGMGTNLEAYPWSLAEAKGPSQVVSYSSRFIDKLSDITEDMSISGSLSIKYGAIGGSGRGSFVDSEKFSQSDLNFYISVKVINQSINWRDALIFNPIPSINTVDTSKTQQEFNKVFGDSFISGFQEGGEFNAVVSMKILNKAKLTDIEAEAKVALTIGPGSVGATGAVHTAKKNLEMNTETTIQVSWSGGGHIKDPRQAWTIDSLMEAAARFPDLVAQSPQRTYAILSKYDTLRSFADKKPAGVSPLAYENAQLYTSAMMDTYMEYKALYKRLTADMASVRDTKTKRIVAWAANTTTSDQTGPFESNVKGLDDARRRIREQMMLIVTEVDKLTVDPSKLSPDYKEPFLPAATFATKVPIVEDIVKAPEVPLSGKEIKPVEEKRGSATSELLVSKDEVTSEEENYTVGLSQKDPSIGEHLKLTRPCGSVENGTYFNNLDFVHKDFTISSIAVELSKGALSALRVQYTNGLAITHGKTTDKAPIILKSFSAGEKLIAGSIETGCGPDDGEQERVISLKLYTNRGRQLLGTAASSTLSGGAHNRDGTIYLKVKTTYFDTPFQNGSLRGFWGRSTEKQSSDGVIWRLGLVWGDAGSSDSTAPLVVADGPEEGSVFAQAGHAYVKWDQGRRGERFKTAVTFPFPYSTTPTIISGLREYDLAKSNKMEIGEESNDSISPTGFQATTYSIDEASTYGVSSSWMVLPQNEISFQTGEVTTRGIDTRPNIDIKVMFPRKYKSDPTVVCWLKAVTTTTKGDPPNHRVLCTVKSVGPDYAVIAISTWHTTDLVYAKVGWLAWDKEQDGRLIKTGSLLTKHNDAANKNQEKEVRFERGAFKKPPVMFFAFESWDVKTVEGLRATASLRVIEKDRFTATLGAWDATQYESFIGRWIAIEGP
ncbi:hypothetical protein CB0940_04188 [Cercospora beticola]|uniref:H-type lectin domain-containing protein n=1 Tax=Cercospora beticola TaxID=122368 RepID=A0A2G5HL68_CERBT|nr:hypothetical protein CB0940_04188 [Cercospora beticola]PIA93280.1 hypothetical protein CB0940_04188 [Cercospora beticola]WPB01405.1 hypothetical protein RHO25_006031 [Cercospora beticola]CAK1363810.1 unnamed protein product [Cercospora beticola]